MLHRYVSFSDESSIGEDFVVIGGVLCKDAIAREFRGAIERAMTPVADTLKWERVRDNNLFRYERVVDEFFAFNSEHLIDFHALIVPTREADHATYNDGDSELGFNKFVVQHLFGLRRKVGRCAQIRHTYAFRTSPHDLTMFSEYLDRMARKRWGPNGANCLGVEHVPFRRDKMFWLADILIGAVGSAFNNRNEPDSPKGLLQERIRRASGVTSLAEETPGDMRHFKIWRHAMGGPHGPSREDTQPGHPDRFGPWDW